MTKEIENVYGYVILLYALSERQALRNPLARSGRYRGAFQIVDNISTDIHVDFVMQSVYKSVV